MRFCDVGEPKEKMAAKALQPNQRAGRQGESGLIILASSDSMRVQRDVRQSEQNTSALR